jgi:hypothetical protein
MENVSFYLKRYFNKVSNVYGEEVAAESALEKYDMAESLSYYDSSFNDISGLDIMKEMIINAIIFDDDKKYSSNYINKMVKEEKLEDLFYDITNNIVLKREIVKNYILNINNEHETISDNKKELINYVMNYSNKEEKVLLHK